MPPVLHTDEPDLKRTPRQLSAALNGTPARRTRRLVVVRVQERLANRRTRCTHQESRRLVKRFAVIALEDVSVNRMVRHHGLAKNMHDAGWSQGATFLAYKTAWAGRAFIALHPAYTSQDCAGGGPSPEEDAGGAWARLSVLWVDTREELERGPQHGEAGATVSGTCPTKLRHAWRCDQEVSKRTLATPHKVCEEVSHQETWHHCEPRHVRVSLPRRAAESSAGRSAGNYVRVAASLAADTDAGRPTRRNERAESPASLVHEPMGNAAERP